MNAFIRKQLVVSPRRLAQLFGIVIGGTTLLAVIAIVCIAEWPAASAILWHMRNGNTVAVEGHSFRVPLLYEPEVSKGGKQIEIVEYRGLLSGGASVTIESSPRSFDSISIDHLQKLLTTAGNKLPNKPLQSTPVTLKAKKLSFACVDLVSTLGESLICDVVGTNLKVYTTAPPAHIQETRKILVTSD